MLELRGDWADICNAVRERLYPGVAIEHPEITKRKKRAS